MPDDDPLLTTAEVAALAGVTPERIRQLARAGKLPWTPLPGLPNHAPPYGFRRVDVQPYLDERAQWQQAAAEARAAWSPRE